MGLHRRQQQSSAAAVATGSNNKEPGEKSSVAKRRQPGGQGATMLGENSVNGADQQLNGFNNSGEHKSEIANNNVEMEQVSEEKKEKKIFFLVCRVTS